MSVSFSIHASTGDYRVHIKPGLLAEAAQQSGNVLYICDRALLGKAGLPQERTIAVDATEQAKELAALAPVFSQCKTMGANRATTLYAVGGGVVQDISCFIASTYMRGMKWVYFPTTLLGMVDSCIGGKSSINVMGVKNLIGTFHPPESVQIDPTLAQSLGMNQKIAGLCEAVKITFAHTGDAFEQYLALAPDPSVGDTALGAIIGLTLRTKKWFIEIDEFDKKERQLLNFGHTFGHAIEGATEYAISHGVAVGVGMLCALAYRRDYSAAGAARVGKLKAHLLGLLAQDDGLQAQLAKLDADLATTKFVADKKHDSEHYWIIAPDAEGYLQRTGLEKTDASLASIRALFAKAKDGYDQI